MVAAPLQKGIVEASMEKKPKRRTRERILETEARQRQPVGIQLAHRLVRIGARRALKRHRARRIGSSGSAHGFDKLARGGGIGVHARRFG